MSKGGKIVLLLVIIFIVISFIASGALATYLVIKAVKDYDWDGGYDTYEPVTIKESWKLESSLDNFSVAEYDEFTAALEEDLEEQNNNYKYSTSEGFGLGESLDFAISDTASAPAQEASIDSDGYGGGTEETITNTQELGVDEGDIVKAYGDYLIVLRRGRIFTVQVKDGDQDLLTPVYKADAYPKGYTYGGWYDEMLIYENTAVVIGYSYSMEATEVGLFDLNDQGQITHKDTYFIDSNDYYSSRNYASRLVGGQLLFYMPYYLIDYGYYSDEYKARCKIPEIKKWTGKNKTTNGTPLLKKTDIFKPVQDTSSPTLHTVASCDLTSENFDCTAKAILGPYARNFYVSPNAVYVWVTDTDYYGYDYYDEEEENGIEPNAYVYAMPLDMQGVGVATVYGSPIDQFSFKESDDEYLNVLVRDQGFGDAMWNPEYTDSNLSFLRFSLDKFSSKPKAVPKTAYQVLPAPYGYTIQNRFVGDHLLYGSGSGWYEEDADSSVYVLNYKERRLTKEIELASSADRIEVLDNENAVVVGTRNDDLLFNWIALPDQVVDTYIISNASQGETRSHGFFYSAKEGILGLPVKSTNAQGYEQLWYESSAVKFLKVDKDAQQFSDVGYLSSSDEDRVKELTETDDDCEYSCVDWYGNSRPIFYDDRIFALMGYELVEGELTANNQIKEAARTNYYNEL